MSASAVSRSARRTVTVTLPFDSAASLPRKSRYVERIVYVRAEPRRMGDWFDDLEERERVRPRVRHAHRGAALCRTRCAPVNGGSVQRRRWRGPRRRTMWTAVMRCCSIAVTSRSRTVKWMGRVTGVPGSQHEFAPEHPDLGAGPAHYARDASSL